MIEDHSRPAVPLSFVALFVEPGRTRPSEPRDVIQQRYEFCEDLASMLVDTAKAKHWELQVAESDVLARIHDGLVAGAIEISPDEATWVSRRLAELLGWERLA